jgi:ApaG protein
MKNHNKNDKKPINPEMGKDIYVSTIVNFVPDESESKNHKFTWVYEITIRNGGETIVQLLNRFWRIVDMSGKVEEVRGVGVVGLQPIIKPGKEFTYTSYCQLTTPQGTMEGMFEMQNLDDDQFQVAVPKFILSAPSEMTKSFKSRLH